THRPGRPRVVAERTRLRRAPAGTGDRVPAVGSRPSGDAGRRVHVEDCASGGELLEVDRPGRGVEHETGHHEPDEVVGRTVVDRNGQVGRKLVDAHGANIAT